MKEEDIALTTSVPKAAKILGIGRNAAYEAVKRGEIPSIKFGNLIRVPLKALYKKANGEG